MMTSVVMGFVLLWTVLTSYCILAQQLTLTPSEEDFVLFSDRSFFVRCQGSNADSLSWVYNDINEIMNNIGRVHIERPSTDSENKTLDLFFEKLLPQDKGIYSCIGSFSSDDGQVTKKAESFKMTVYQTISFEDTPLVQSAKEGEDAMLRCIVSGNPSPSVQWRYQGRRIQMDRKFRFMKQDGVNIMVISKVKRSDKGEYTCRGKQVNDHFSDFKETDITFLVEYSPESGSSLDKEEVRAPLGGISNLTCEARGEPEPQFKWTVFGQPIGSEDNFRIINTSNSSILQISNISQDNFGDYQCYAQNKLGTLEKQFVLSEGSIPSPPDVSVRLISANSVHVTINEDVSDVNVQPKEFVVQYKTKYQSWKDASSETFSKDSNAPYIIKDLQEGTQYEFRAAIVTTSGTGIYGNSINASTGRFLEAHLRSSAPISLSSSIHVFLLWLYLIHKWQFH